MKRTLILFISISALVNAQIKYSFKSFSEFKTTLDSVCNISDEVKRSITITQLWDTLKTHKNIPFAMGDSVAFLYRSNTSSVKWAGDFNSWNSNASGWEGNKVGLTNDVWLLIKRFPSNARLDYKIITGGSNWITDPSNPNQQYSGVGTYNSELRMPDWEYPSETIQRSEITKGNFSNNFLYVSSKLGYNVYYRVYTPFDYENLSALPVIYVTDGHEYSDERMGSMITVLDNLIYDEKIKPVIAVFIDPRSSPSSSGQNRRAEQYINNSKFADFAADELVLRIDADYKTNRSADARAILGTSLGGLNSAFLGYTKSNVFHLIGIHSPAFQTGTSIYSFYQNSEKLPLKIFLSTGTIYDTQSNTLQMKSILESKGYPFMYIEVPEGHSWGNWRALIDEPLIYFFKGETQTGMIETEQLPTEINLGNFPNPFNPTTKIWFSLPKLTRVTLYIYNSLGEKVDTLLSGLEVEPGYHKYDFNPINYSSGIYFAMLQTDYYSISRKMIFLK